MYNNYRIFYTRSKMLILHIFYNDSDEIYTKFVMQFELQSETLKYS